MGSHVGVIKVAAARIGVTVAEYEAHRAAGLKWCTRCKLWQPIASFDRDKSRGDGFRATCSRHYTRTRSGPTKRERREREATGQAWCRGCGEWVAASKVYSGLCREHANEEARAWYASGSPAALARRGRAIAYRRSLVPIPTWWAEEVRAAFDRLCAYGCGRRGDTWDHIWPVSKGGVSAPGNLAPACGSCNSSKKNTEPTPWVERGLSAFPSQWLNLWDLAVQTGHDDWCSWNEAPWSTATVLTDSLEGAI